MKDALVAIALVVLALPAHAQLYRCQKGGTIVFSESPCAPNAVRKELDGQAPPAAEAEAARQRALAERGEVRAIERREAAERAVKEVYAAQADAERAAKKRRCDQYLARAEDAKRMKEVYVTDRYRNAEDARRKAAEDAHFSECYASNGR
ncbi:MAG: DUF4124 domain-containing protein [Azonexus sp.]